jgi:hypothetical protein
VREGGNREYADAGWEAMSNIYIRTRVAAAKFAPKDLKIFDIAIMNAPGVRNIYKNATQTNLVDELRSSH